MCVSSVVQLSYWQGQPESHHQVSTFWLLTPYIWRSGTTRDFQIVPLRFDRPDLQEAVRRDPFVSDSQHSRQYENHLYIIFKLFLPLNLEIYNTHGPPKICNDRKENSVGGESNLFLH